MEPKRFYRSTSDRVIGGVAAGLAEYFSLDPVLIRLLFVIFALFGGGGVLVYIIFWIVIPPKPLSPDQTINKNTMETQQNPQDEHIPPAQNLSDPGPQKPVVSDHRRKGSLIGGLVLVTLGVIFLADEFLPNIDFGDLWPLILVVIGAGLLINTFRKHKPRND